MVARRKVDVQKVKEYFRIYFPTVGEFLNNSIGYGSIGYIQLVTVVHVFSKLDFDLSQS